ncbi:MAG: YadA C-terminal domain-containing protein [Pseudomonadota bacterium]
MSDAQFAALETRVNGFDSRLTGLEFALEDVEQSLSGGIAAAAALGSAIAMPGKDFVVAGNVATYRGEQGFAITFTGRATENFALSAGVAGNSGDGDVVAQAGFAFGF